MATAVNGVGGTTSTNTTANRAMDAMQSEDFFKILVTELQQQDPLQPSKTSDMIGQVSQIRGIELSQRLSETLSQLTKQQHATGASELLGKYVTAQYADSSGTSQQVAGVVTGVQFGTDGTAVLELDTGQAIPLSTVTHIATPTDAQAAAAASKSSASGTGTATTTAKTSNAKNVQGTTQPRLNLFPWLSMDAGVHL
jgi:flagellar basal-body rod modification protein FlgD